MQKKTLITSILIGISCGATVPTQPAFAADAVRPNIVSIVIDDMGFSDLGYFGGEVPTPNLDALMEEGIVLTNFYAAPTSSPSRAMLFTGKDSHQVGIGVMNSFKRPEQEGKFGYEGDLLEDVPTIGEVLQAGGYETMMTGKWDMGVLPGQYAHDRGFEQTKGLLLPGGDFFYLSDENGKHITTHEGSIKKLGRKVSMYNENGQEVTEFPPNGYVTEYYTDSAIAMLKKRDRNRPFYLNVAHIAPHSPWQAPVEVTAKYLEVYAQGWDILREQRFAKQKAKGLVPADAKLPPRPDELKAWDELSPSEQKVEANQAAVYAATIEIMDTNVGRLIDYLKAQGEYENTVFFVYSDNGAESASVYLALEVLRADTIKNYKTIYGEDFDPENYEGMGTTGWSIGPRPEWAMLFGTPFNEYKGSMFEGGIHVSAFFHYPRAKASGLQYNCLSSIMDIAPTFVDLAGVKYPSEFNGKPITPMQGISMANIFEGQFNCDAERSIVLEFDGMKAVRKGNWALSQRRFDDHWYLFNLKEDMFEHHDLSAERPDKLAEMTSIYEQYAKENGVIPVSTKPLPILSVASTNGTQPEAILTGGVSSRKPNNVWDVPTWEIDSTVKITDPLDVSASITPAPNHVGQPGEVFAYGKFSPADGSRPFYFGITSTGLVKQRIAFGLPVLTSGPLPMNKTISVDIASLRIPGTAEMTVGYRMANGTTVFNEQVIRFTITQ